MNEGGKMLYPRVNEHRNVVNLNGLWRFQIINDDYDITRALSNYRLIGVPSSYNDLFTEKLIRDHVGEVIYEKMIQLPKTQDEWRLRIGAAGHKCEVYIDGALICEHEGGFLPIDCLLPVSDMDEYRLTLKLDNRLEFGMLPTGHIENGKQKTYFDFKNFSGIHRDVLVYSVPKDHIEDIIIETTFKNDDVLIKYEVLSKSKSIFNVEIIDPFGNVIQTLKGKSNITQIENPVLWDIGQGNLYKLKVTAEHDSYIEEFGLRDIQITNNKLLLNGKEIYLKGFGMHEDHETIGKGNNTALNIRDFNLLKWIGANSFRTSHYPYAEEIYDLADRMGILIINEMPAVGMYFWNDSPVFINGVVDERTKKTYFNQFDELIARDKNHPSVIIYSLANEARTFDKGAYPFFKDIFEHARSKTKLPLMIVEAFDSKDNVVAQLADIIGINRYIGWYTSVGDISQIEKELTNSLKGYHEKFSKPIILTEFGADTISGLHKLPSVIFSEEFQVEFIMEYIKVLRKLDFVIGEHIWNFADFDTKQELTRVDGNKKGVFTRNRQPKMVAHFLKKLWEE